MGLHQIEELLYSKGNSQEPQQRPNKMGEDFANYPSDKELISRIYRELKKLSPSRAWWRTLVIPAFGRLRPEDLG